MSMKFLENFENAYCIQIQNGANVQPMANISRHIVLDLKLLQFIGRCTRRGDLWSRGIKIKLKSHSKLIKIH